MKRFRGVAAPALLLLASGLLAAACQVTPNAASANGDTIAVSSLNSQLDTLHNTIAGACLVQAEFPQLASSIGQGAAGTGTYPMGFVNIVLSSDVSQLLESQYAASNGISISSTDLAAAKTDYLASLTGSISAAIQQAQSAGTVPACQATTGGAPLTATQVLAALPSDLQNSRIRQQAVEEQLLSHDAPITEEQIAAYYVSHPATFTVVCVSQIVTDTQAHADQYVAQIQAGASFASVAQANSLDQQTAASGGQLGCNFSLAEVEQSLSVPSVTVGAPLPPVQDPNSGQWVIYGVTSQSLVPLATAAPLARRELLQTTANVNRVTTELVAFARRSNVSVNPQYGTWRGLSVAPPTSPPAEFLLPSFAGSAATLSPSLGVGGSGSPGTPGSSGTSTGG